MLVKDVMKSPVLSVGPETTLEEAYRLLLEKGIRHLPVLKNGKLLGIVTDRDIRLATSHLNPKGLMPRVYPGGGARPPHGLSGGAGVNIHSLLSYPEEGEYVRAVVRVNTLETHLLAQGLQEAGFEVLWPPKKPW
jgi:acetoin utilization protein AcuB